jgi:hypothetical protein
VLRRRSLVHLLKYGGIGGFDPQPDADQRS